MLLTLPTDQCERLAKGDCPLGPIVMQLQQMLEAQAIEIEALKAKVKELSKSSSSPDPQFKPNRKKGKRRKKPGREKGHPGTGRHRPEQIDEVIERLDNCPYCGEELDDGDVHSTHDHLQEDIIPSLVKAILYRHRHYHCPQCKRKIDTVAEGDEIPNARLRSLCVAGCSIV
ncbi:MAG: hypothetical protein P9L92_01185 [Candidatus Electryonea clarkiae]|nr:hypothetical protein [Candidatus Electryonea clarkiae]MDP8286637.1 hypothetical protein [Candidatus Electryonea clarkiae]